MTPDTTWPTAPGGETLRPPLSAQDLRSFAGEPAFVGPLRPPVDYYLPRWISVLDSGASHVGFNWAAALFGSNWCFWRKLYGLGIIILVAEFITSVLLTLIVAQAISDNPDQATLSAIAWAAFVPVRALLGRYANTLYLSRAIETVAMVREEHAAPEQQQTLLAARGGTSWLVLGAALAIQFVLMFSRALPA